MTEDVIEMYERLKNVCKMGIKAYSNISIADELLTKILEIADTDDVMVVYSLYVNALISYSRPFVNTNTGIGKHQYKLRYIQKVNGFDRDIHNHFIEARKKMIAHDDFDMIEPILIIMNQVIREIDFSIPASITISNKSIGFPKLKADILRMSKHCKSVLAGVLITLHNDMDVLRAFCLNNQEVSRKIKTIKNYGSYKIREGENSGNLPDYKNDPILNLDDPLFECVQGGYHFKEVKVSKDYFGPETITLPSGDIFTITPNIKSTPKK